MRLLQNHCVINKTIKYHPYNSHSLKDPNFTRGIEKMMLLSGMKAQASGMRPGGIYLRELHEQPLIIQATCKSIETYMNES